MYSPPQTSSYMALLRILRKIFLLCNVFPFCSDICINQLMNNSTIFIHTLKNNVAGLCKERNIAHLHMNSD